MVELYDLAGKRVWVAGHTGLVGSALMRALAGVACDVVTATSSALDLRDPAATLAWLRGTKPDCAIIAAARVGGILANRDRPAEFLHDNLAMATSTIDGAHRAGVERLVFLGSSCIYPKRAPQPIEEAALLTGALEPTNAPYAIAKIAGVTYCETYARQYGRQYVAAMPTNLYGPGDSYDPEGSHVIPGLIRRAHAAKVAGEPTLTIWGTGKPRREFLYSDDAADGILHVLRHGEAGGIINVGSGTDITIAELAEIICETVGYEGELVFDASKPDGTMRKLMSGSKLKALDWAPKTDLRKGLSRVYADFLSRD